MAYRVTEYVNNINIILKEIEALEKELDTVEKIALTKCLTDVLPVLSHIAKPITVEYKTNNTDVDTNEEDVTYFEHEGIILYENYKYVPKNDYEGTIKIDNVIYCTNSKLYTTFAKGVSRDEPFNYKHWKAEVKNVDIDYVVEHCHIRDIINKVETELYRKVKELKSIQSDRTTSLEVLKRYISEER